MGCSTAPRLQTDGREGALQRFEFTRLAMGVQARIVLYANDRPAAERAAAEGFAVIAHLEAVMSDYRSRSELMQLSRAAGREAVPISAELFEILSTAQQIAHLSDGAFDVTIGPVSKLWREARTMNRIPTTNEIEQARALVNWRELQLNGDDRTAHLQRHGMSLDLGGIAKGYAADRAVKRLKELGFPRCMVSLAGDIAVGDPPPDETAWQIAIAPAHDAITPERRSVANACISTAGDAEQFTMIDGVRHSHILDPRTGMGVTHRASITVISSRGEMADALSSAASVLGPGQMHLLLQHFPDAKVIVSPQ